MAGILVIDDEPRMVNVLCRALARDGHSAEGETDATHGLQRVLREDFELIVLDLLMPALHGSTVLERTIAERPHQSVLVLSALSDVETKVRCFEQGAADYLTKPFALAELLARVRTRLAVSPHRDGNGHVEVNGNGHFEVNGHANGNGNAKVNGHANGNGHVKVNGHGNGHVKVNGHGNGQVKVNGHGNGHLNGNDYGSVLKAGSITLNLQGRVADAGTGPVAMSNREFLLLKHLMSRAGEVCSRQEVLSDVWGCSFDPGTNVVDVCIRRLRAKVGPDVIETVRNVGYALVV